MAAASRSPRRARRTRSRSLGSRTPLQSGTRERRLHVPRIGIVPSVGDSLGDWTEQEDALTREFELPSFPAAISFVDRLAELAESENHHPDIDIRYRRVTVRWTTHSEGGITEKDREMAERTSALAAPSRAIAAGKGKPRP